MPTKRNAKYEMIRIVAILMVTCHHLLIFGAQTCGYTQGYSLEFDGWFGPLLNSFVVCGVNIFILISGWWGINRIWRPLLMLIANCLIFGGIAWVIDNLLSQYNCIGHSILQAPHKAWDWGLLWQSIKFTQWWFVEQYALLVLLAPLVEYGLKRLDGVEGRKCHRHALAGLTIASCLFGWFWGIVSPNGYSVLNFLLLYVSTRYLRLWTNDKLIVILYRHAGTIAVACGLILWAGFIWARPNFSGLYQWHSSTLWWAYNNPLVIIESLALFAWLSKSLHWVASHELLVNKIALPVFGIYLLQSSIPFFSWRNAWAQLTFNTGGYPLLLLEISLFFVLLWFVCYPLTGLVNKLMSLGKRKL